MRAADHAPSAILGWLPQLEEFVRLEGMPAHRAGLTADEVTQEVVAVLLKCQGRLTSPPGPPEARAASLRLTVRHVVLQLADREYRARRELPPASFPRAPRHARCVQGGSEPEPIDPPAALVELIRARLETLPGPDVPLARALIKGDKLAAIAEREQLSERQVERRIAQLAKILWSAKPAPPAIPDPQTSSPLPPVAPRDARAAAFHERGKLALKLENQGLSQRCIGVELHISAAAAGQLLRRARRAFSLRDHPPLA
jgi:hypothetical protein